MDTSISPRINNRQLILSLIKDDLINSKLVNTLNSIGIDASDYGIKAGDLVFMLMGFKDSPHTELIRDHYLELSKRTKHIDVAGHAKLFHGLALEIYEYLVAVCPKPVVEPIQE